MKLLIITLTIFLVGCCPNKEQAPNMVVITPPDDANNNVYLVVSYADQTIKTFRYSNHKDDQILHLIKITTKDE